MKITANIKGLRWRGIEFPRDGYSRECTAAEIEILKTVPLFVAILTNDAGKIINQFVEEEEVRDADTNIGRKKAASTGNRKRRKN